MPTLDKETIDKTNIVINKINKCISLNNTEKGLKTQEITLLTDDGTNLETVYTMMSKIIVPLVGVYSSDTHRKRSTTETIIRVEYLGITEKLKPIYTDLIVEKLKAQKKSAASAIIGESAAISNSQCFSKTGVKKEMSLDELINHAQGKTKGYSGNRTKNILLKKGILKYEGSFFNKKLVVDDDKKNEFIRNQLVK